jgi:ferric-dicitrate binding protein FerR (iron transport regulator)
MARPPALTGTYALMARCLAGEATPEDIRQLKTLCDEDPAWCAEFELMRGLWAEAYATADGKTIEEDLDRVSRKLKARGLRE